jgi:hypothetical protein
MKEIDEDDVIEKVLNGMVQERGKSLDLNHYMKTYMSHEYSDERLREIIRILVFEGVIEKPKAFYTHHTYQLSTHGLEIMSHGGRRAYDKKKKDDLDFEQRRRSAELDNLESSTKVNKWMLKTRWLPHILSILSVLVAILALLKSFGKV